MTEPSHAEIMRAIGKLEGVTGQIGSKVDQLHADIVDLRADAKAQAAIVGKKLDGHMERLRDLEQKQAAETGARNRQRAIVTSAAALLGGSVAVIVKALWDKMSSGPP